MLKLGLFPVVTAAVVLMSGCAAQYPMSTKSLSLAPMNVLSQQLEETSGLYCTDEGLFTINDSGNEATVFELDYDAGVKQAIH